MKNSGRSLSPINKPTQVCDQYKFLMITNGCAPGNRSTDPSRTLVRVVVVGGVSMRAPSIQQ